MFSELLSNARFQKTWLYKKYKHDNPKPWQNIAGKLSNWILLTHFWRQYSHFDSQGSRRREGGKGEGCISLIPIYHFYPLHWYLDQEFGIRWISIERKSVCIVRDINDECYLYFFSLRRSIDSWYNHCTWN